MVYLVDAEEREGHKDVEPGLVDLGLDVALIIVTVDEHSVLGLIHEHVVIVDVGLDEAHLAVARAAVAVVVVVVLAHDEMKPRGVVFSVCLVRLRNRSKRHVPN